MKNKLIYILFLSIFIITFTSCSKRTITISEGGNNFESLISKLILESSKKLQSIIKFDDVVLVTDFVNLQNLKNKSQLGFLLSDMTKDKLLALNILVKEIEFRKNLSLSNSGINILSRDTRDILSQSTNSLRYAIVGTYSISTKSLNVFLKLIDTQNGTILSSAYERTPIDNEILQLEDAHQNAQRPHLVL